MYLLELRESNCYDSNVSSVSISDIVVVHHDNRPCGFWKLARIANTVVGRDGYASERSCHRTTDKGGCSIVLQHPT